MSFIHYCAVGLFEAGSLVVGEPPRAMRPLDRVLVEELARRHGVPVDETGPYAALRWRDDGSIVLMYVSIRVLEPRVEFARALMRATGAVACEVRAGPRWYVTRPRCFAIDRA